MYASMNAYDYDSQQWKTGSKAAALHLAQSKETLDLLTGPRGAEYARFIGLDPSAAKNMISRLTQQIAIAEGNL